MVCVVNFHYQKLIHLITSHGFMLRQRHNLGNNEILIIIKKKSLSMYTRKSKCIFMDN